MSETHETLREKHIIGSRSRERLITVNLCAGLRRRGICLAGISEARWPFSFVRRHPGFTQILVCLDGVGEVRDDHGAWVRCEAGMAYLTPPRALHAYRTLAEDDGAPWEIAWVQYVPGDRNVRPDGEPTPLSSLSGPVITRINPVPLATTLRGLHDECMADAPDATILEDWASLLHAQAQRIALLAETDHRLRRLWTEVTIDPGYPWTVETLAERARMSGEQLRRLCQREVARSPMRHVTYLRMRHAASLLASGFYTVQDAAETVGYDNPYAFSTAFKRCLGVPPSTYRSANRVHLI